MLLRAYSRPDLSVDDLYSDEDDAEAFSGTPMARFFQGQSKRERDKNDDDNDAESTASGWSEASAVSAERKPRRVVKIKAAPGGDSSSKHAGGGQKQDVSPSESSHTLSPHAAPSRALLESALPLPRTAPEMALTPPPQNPQNQLYRGMPILYSDIDPLMEEPGASMPLHLRIKIEKDRANRYRARHRYHKQPRTRGSKGERLRREPREERERRLLRPTSKNMKDEQQNYPSNKLIKQRKPNNKITRHGNRVSNFHQFRGSATGTLVAPRRGSYGVGIGSASHNSPDYKDKQWNSGGRVVPGFMTHDPLGPKYQRHNSSGMNLSDYTYSGENERAAARWAREQRRAQRDELRRSTARPQSLTAGHGGSRSAAQRRRERLRGLRQETLDSTAHSHDVEVDEDEAAFQQWRAEYEARRRHPQSRQEQHQDGLGYQQATACRMILPCAFEQEIVGLPTAFVPDDADDVNDIFKPGGLQRHRETKQKRELAARMLQRLIRTEQARSKATKAVVILRKARDDKLAEITDLARKMAEEKKRLAEKKRKEEQNRLRKNAASIVIVRAIRNMLLCQSAKLLLSHLKKDRARWDSDGSDSETEDDESASDGDDSDDDYAHGVSFGAIGGVEVPLKVVAAEVIQAFYRGHKVRRSMRPVYVLARAAQVAIARTYRGRLGRHQAGRRRLGYQDGISSIAAGGGRSGVEGQGNLSGAASLLPFKPHVVEDFRVSEWDDQLASLRAAPSPFPAPQPYRFTSPDELRFRRAQRAAEQQAPSGRAPRGLLSEEQILLPHALDAPGGEDGGRIANEAQALVLSAETGEWTRKGTIRDVMASMAAGSAEQQRKAQSIQGRYVGFDLQQYDGTLEEMVREPLQGVVINVDVPGARCQVKYQSSNGLDTVWLDMTEVRPVKYQSI